MNRLPIPITLDTFKKPGKHQQQGEASGEASSHEAEENDQVAGVEMNEADHGVASASANSNDNQPRGQQLIEEEEEELTLEDHAMIVTAILKPVAITMLFVVFCVYALHVADQPTTTVAWMVYQEHASDSTVEKLGGSIINALLFVVLIVLVTCVLVLLYKYRCLKLIYDGLLDLQEFCWDSLVQRYFSCSCIDTIFLWIGFHLQFWPGTL